MVSDLNPLNSLDWNITQTQTHYSPIPEKVRI